MSELKWGPVGKKIEPRWGPERERLVRVGIGRRVRNRRAAMYMTASLMALALVAGGLRTFVSPRIHAPSVLALAPSAVAAVTATAPAVTVTHLSSDTVLEAMPDRGGRGFELRSGGARFMASHDAEHPLVVVAGDVVIEDLGTTFTVQYLSADRLEVAVEEGWVQVRVGGANTGIAAGERQQFPVLSRVSAMEEPRRTVADLAPSSWRALAENGRYDEAHTALKRAGPYAVRDVAADLLLAADAARLSGDPAAAVPYLERVVRKHSSDPRSSLASFTLGRVLLDELGRPREAADAFARAREAGGPLAEDALAREVEAASRAGDATRSRELAREYQTLYPNGRRAKAVSRFGGLD
jgi:transmembrane sensor